MQMKSLFASKTFWLHVLTAVGTFGGMAVNVVPAPWTPYILAFQSVAGVALRLVTKEPVSVLGQ
jgi:hypothetical protein